MSILIVGLPAALLCGLAESITAHHDIRKRRITMYRKRRSRLFE